MGPVAQLEQVLAEFGRLVGGVADEQWSEPTPCDGWTVQDLVEHVVRGNLLVAAVLRDESAPEAAAGRARYDESAQALVTGFGLPGVMERTVQMPLGAVPGMVALHLRVVETLVHGWDLAAAVGAPTRFDDAVAEQELTFTRGALSLIPPDRSPFGPPQQVDGAAPPLDRLAALLGRRVRTG